ncbi:helix-turn-helix domain-containing protein [Paenibacillus thalictri]|nr:helix-turn-helix transcriptional regulator [Paenibacillus thalictri]
MFVMSKKMQIAVANILLTSLSVVLIGLIIFTQASDIIRSQIENAHLMSLKSTRGNFENYFTKLNQSAVQMEKIPDFEKWLNQPADRKVNQLEMFSLVQLLVRIHASLDYVDNVVLYDPLTEVQYSSQPTLGDYNMGYQSLLDEFALLNTDYAFLTKNTDGASTYVYIRKLPIFISGPSYYLLFHVNSKLFYDYLGITDDNKSTIGTAFIMDKKGTPIGKGTFAGIEDITRNLAHDREITSLSAEQNRTYSKNGMLITCVSSSMTGWIFGLAVPDKQFLSKIIALRNMTLIVLAAAVVLAILAVMASNHWFFRGWSKIIRLIDDSSGAKTTGKRSTDEFEKIYSHVYQLKHRLQEMLPEAKEAYVRKALETGVIASKDLGDQLGLPLNDETAYCCFAVEIDYYNQLKETYSEWDLFYFGYGVACVIREVLGDKGLAVKLNDGKLLGIFYLPDSEEPKELGERRFQEQVNQNLQTIHHFISDNFPVTVTIGVSRPKHGTKHLHLASAQALEVLKQKFASGTNQIMYYEEPSNAKTNVLSSDEVRRIERDFIESIRSRDIGETAQALQRLRRLAPEGDYRKLQHALVDLTLSVYREISADLSAPPDTPALSRLLELSTLDEWLGSLQQQAESLIALLTAEYQLQMEQAANKIKAHLASRLQEDIRLEDCCKPLGIPVSVAKHALKEVYETTFTELLLLERIEQSKLWLRETDIGVDEIAKRLYYSNAQSFTRTFKKITGMPPGQYRKINARSESANYVSKPGFAKPSSDEDCRGCVLEPPS